MCSRVFLLSLIFLLSSQEIFAQSISRIDIQNYFNQTPGNASYLPAWYNKYLNKKVTWTGIIFSIQFQKDFNRTEIAMRILPLTKMYDTIVYVPGNVSDKFKENDEVTFSGNITRGVDMLGVKEVQVNVGTNMGDNFGQYVFSDNGIVNVNFLRLQSQEE